MSKLIVTVGAPGSGKSTMADAMFDTASVLRLERDRFRECMWGTRRRYWDLAGKSEELHKKMSQVIGTSMCKAMDTSIAVGLHSVYLLSDTGFGWGSVRSFHERARKHGMTVEVFLFLVPWEVLEQRNLERQPPANRIPTDLLRDSYERIHGLKDHDRWWFDRSRCHRLTRFDENGRVLP